MWICAYCKTENDEQNKFCKECGHIKQSAETTVNQKQAQYQKNKVSPHKKFNPWIAAVCVFTVLFAVIGVASVKSHTKNTLNGKNSDCFVSVVQTDSYYDATTIGLKADGTVEVFGKTEFLNSDPAEWTDIESIVSDGDVVAGLKSDGTVVIATTYFEDDDFVKQVEGWNNITEADIFYGWYGYGIVGLKKDGTVNATGNYVDYVNTAKWKNIEHILAESCGNGEYIIGITKDGTAVYDGTYAEEWSEENVVYVDSSGWVTIAVKEDGTVSAAGEDAGSLQDELSAWSDISKVYAGETSVVGLKKDGTVVYAGSTFDGGNLKELKNWTNIEEIYGVKEYIIVGLKSDGTLVCADMLNGDDLLQLGYSIDELETWTDIVDVSVTRDHIVGIKSDGTLIAIGNNDNGQCDVDAGKDPVSSEDIVSYEIIHIESDDIYYIANPVLMTDDGYYIIERSGFADDYDSAVPTLYYISYDGEISEVHEIMPPVINMGADDKIYYEYIGIALTDEGRFVSVMNPIVWVESSGTEIRYDTIIYSFDADGYETCAPVKFKDDGTYNEYSLGVVTSGENTAAFTVKSGVSVVGLNGKETARITDEKYGSIYSLLKLPDGRIVAVTEENWTYKLITIDLDSQRLNETKVELPEYWESWDEAVCGDEIYDLYYVVGEDLYGADIDTGKQTKIINVCDYGVNLSDYSYTYYMCSDGTLICIPTDPADECSVDIVKINLQSYLGFA